ncbi:MAG TPA: pyridoxal-phosphate dependent enzyme [Candidatus Paceibacterota bacterium]|nr:pyridoxal-phosphate dependent enzyme [Candidatus Paceibacterota bacterium]
MLPPHWEAFFKSNGIKLHIVILYENEARTGKIWPASEIIMKGVERGDHKGSTKAIDSTSGGFGRGAATVIRMARARDPSFPVTQFVAVVPRSLPKGKREMLIENGIELIDAEDAIDAMRVAEQVAAEKGYWYTRQYWNPDNSKGYWAIAHHLANEIPELGICAWGVGSGGGCSGIMPVLTSSFRDRPFKLWRVAVVAEDGHKIGGVRDQASLEPGTLKWRSPNIDDVRFIAENVSYRNSAALWRQKGLRVGPSTGFAVEGACLAARSLGIMRQLDDFRGGDGYVHIAVPAVDERTPYRDEFEEKGFYGIPKTE